MRTVWMASLIGVVVAVGCGGSSSKPDGGSGTAGSSGGSTGAGGTGTGGTGTGGTGTGTGGTGGAGGTGGGSCGNVEPCGGSLVGTWNLTSECINSMILAPQTQAICAQATVTNVSISVSGNLTFAANMTYTSHETGTLAITWDVPASCLTGETCDYFASMFATELPAGATFTCTGSAGCSCTEAALVTTDDNGTYGTTGSNLVITSAVSGQTQNGGYCVQGSTLHLITIDATMHTGPMGGATINKDIVAVKQ